MHATMRTAHKNQTPVIARDTRNACAAGISIIRTSFDRCIADVVSAHKHRFEARCADSESRFLAMKKFSCPPASSPIAARQNRFFARIATADSQRYFDRDEASSIDIEHRARSRK
jgi:hypothetical protein